MLRPHACVAPTLLGHANIRGKAFAAVEAHARPPVRNEEHRDLVVVLDLPAEAFRVEALRLLHVIDAQKDRADVRIHSAPPLAKYLERFSPAYLRAACALATYVASDSSVCCAPCAA